MATRKTYNSIDNTDILLNVENGSGYNTDLLIDRLGELECEDYLCTKCKGIMRNASQFGEEQTPVCASCSNPGTDVIPMVRSRKRIATLKVRCPLATRGCKWNGTISEVEIHLGVCEEFITNCPNNCIMNLRRSETEFHMKKCELRKVSCEYCNLEIQFMDIQLHNGMCNEFVVTCPNDCTASLKRRMIASHLKVDCPNELVACDYKNFGCKETIKRCELMDHKSTDEFKHLNMTMMYTVNKVDQLERKVTELTRKSIEQQKTLESLKKEVNEKEVNEKEVLKKEVSKKNRLLRKYPIKS
ncbi:TNF receptor-associated factor 4 [Oopsacas minuta]|uniref:TNF receptor-associated factor 4 n=1 Tax=Oopsacas minuta TaxID=111878 RepID=A0AAV7JFT2_9METZ|nr:TNF receptor-associated factor 4 [Oopsacas minuta]